MIALRRLASALVTTFVVTLLVFAFQEIAPGDPAETLASIRYGTDTPRPELVEAVRKEAGLDQSAPRRYVHCCFGWLLDALHPSHRTEKAANTASIAGVSTPSFWLAHLLILLFAVRLQSLPAAGSAEWRGLVLPVVAVSLVRRWLPPAFCAAGYLKCCNGHSFAPRGGRRILDAAAIEIAFEWKDDAVDIGIATVGVHKASLPNRRKWEAQLIQPCPEAAAGRIADAHVFDDFGN